MVENKFSYYIYKMILYKFYLKIGKRLVQQFPISLLKVHKTFLLKPLSIQRILICISLYNSHIRVKVKFKVNKLFITDF